MTDGVLACDDCTILQARRDVMGEIRDNGWQHGGPRLVDFADGCKEIDGCFEAAGKQTSAGEEEVADGSGLEVESRARGTCSFQDFELEVGEDGADEKCLSCRDGLIERGCEIEEGEEFSGCFCGGGGEAVVEEIVDCGIG